MPVSHGDLQVELGKDPVLFLLVLWSPPIIDCYFSELWALLDVLSTVYT